MRQISWLSLRGRSFLPYGNLSWLLPLLTAAISGCAVEVSGLRLDELNRSLDARTVILEPQYSIYSPYPIERSMIFGEVIRGELSAVRKLFEVSVPLPIIFYLVPLEERNRLHVTDDSHAGTLDGLARHTREVVIYVDPDTNEGIGVPRGVRQNIRHEIAHICINLTGHHADTWLHEGIAEEVESRLLRDGELVSNPIPENLVGVTTVPERYRSLNDVLDWRRGFDPNRYSRWLAHSLVRFLLGSEKSLSFRDHIEHILSLPRRDVLAKEAAWQQWLESLDLASRPGR